MSSFAIDNKEWWLMALNQSGLLLYLVSLRAPFLAPCCFLLHINDITSNIESEIRLFADDCVCYRQAPSPWCGIVSLTFHQ